MIKKTTFYLFGLLLAISILAGCRFDVGTVAGVVKFSGLPCQPGQPDFNVPPCTGPYPNFKLEIYAAAKPDVIALTAMSDAKGNFRIELPVGEYIIYTQKGIKPDQKVENKFKIEKDKTTQLNLSISTGIL